MKDKILLSSIIVVWKKVTLTIILFDTAQCLQLNSAIK
jgi:hypothetical protein